MILVRSYDLLSYRLFEEETIRYRTTDYHWIVNDNSNLLGLNRDNKVCFTWQPHGSQFTIHTEAPEKAVKFNIQKPSALQKDDVLKNIGFTDEWIKIVNKPHDSEKRRNSFGITPFAIIFALSLILQ